MLQACTLTHARVHTHTSQYEWIIRTMATAEMFGMEKFGVYVHIHLTKVKTTKNEVCVLTFLLKF